MNARTWKEVRGLLPSSSLAFLMAMAGAGFLILNPGLMNLALFLYWLGLVILGVSLFGQEMAQRTLGLLLAQPISRWRIFQDKSAAALISFALVAGVFLGMSWIGLGGLLEPENRALLHHAQPPQSENGMLLLGLGLLLPLAAMGGGVGFTIWLRHVHAAFWLALLFPGVLLLLLLVFFRFFPEAASRIPLMLLLALYGSGGLLLGLIRFVRMEWNDAPDEEKAFGAGSWIFPFQMRSSRPWVAALKKELLLHQVSALLAAGLLVLLAGSLWLSSRVQGFDFELLSQFFLFLLLAVFPLLTGATAIAEERKLGTLDWHRAVPFSLPKQWGLKFLVALGIGSLAPYLILAIFFRHLAPLFAEELQLQFLMLVAVTPLLFSVSGFWASSLARNLLHALAIAVTFLLAAHVLFTGAIFLIGSAPPVLPSRLLAVMLIPLMVTAALHLSYRNFRAGDIHWTRNLILLACCYVFAVSSTAALYHRTWEAFGPAMRSVGVPALPPNVPPQIASGFRGIAVIAPDGSLWHTAPSSADDVPWNLVPLSRETNHAALTMGAAHGLVLKRDGSLWSWGGNHHGQLGIGTTGKEPGPLAQVGNDTDWTEIAAGYSHNLALKQDGSLWGWGINAHGQLGWKEEVQSAPAPVRLNDDRWVAIAAFGTQSAAIRQDGAFWVWGGGTAGLPNPPVQRKIPGRVVKLSSAAGSFVALDQDGFYWKVLGHSGWKWRPVELLNDLPVDGPPLDYSWSYFSSVLVAADGTLWQKEIRLFDRKVSDTPSAQIGNRRDWLAVEVSGEMHFALTADGWLWSWGGSSEAYVWERRRAWPTAAGRHWSWSGPRLLPYPRAPTSLERPSRPTRWSGPRLLPYPRMPQQKINLLNWEHP
jgi:alpha-tubulin suppressor-like RCC1 family protein